MNKELKRLIKFLVEKNAWEGFKKNFRNHWPSDEYKRTGWFKFNDASAEDKLAGAFIWLETGEGFDYWLDLQTELVKQTEVTHG